MRIGAARSTIVCAMLLLSCKFERDHIHSPNQTKSPIAGSDSGRAAVDTAHSEVDAGHFEADAVAMCPDGRCRTQCRAPQIECKDRCADLDTDSENCGKCGKRCDVENAVAACVDGTCRVAACAKGFVDLDGVTRNGCECKRSPDVCDGKDNNCDGVVDAVVDGGTVQGSCPCEVVEDVEIDAHDKYPDPLPSGSDYCGPIGCDPDDRGLVFSYCLDNTANSYPWAVCVATMSAKLNAFDVDRKKTVALEKQGVLEVTFDVLSPTQGSVSLYYGQDPRRKYLRLLEPNETKMPGRYTMHFASEQAYFPRWDPVPKSCQGRDSDECGSCPAILDDKTFQFDDVPVTITAEHFSGRVEGRLRLVSIRLASWGCDCATDSDCEELPDLDQCLSTANPNAEPECGWPAKRPKAMCSPAATCDPALVGAPCTVSTDGHTCDSTLTCERGVLVCSAQECEP